MNISNSIIIEVHPTAQVYFGDGGVGQFLSDYLTKNRRRIPITGRISINGSVKILGIPNFRRTSGPMYTNNLQDTHDTTGWGDSVNSNQNWGFQPGGPYSNVAMAWGTTIPAHTTYMPMSLDNLCAAACHVRDNFRRERRREIDFKGSRSCNPVVNPRVNWRGDDREGPVDQ